MNFAKPQSRAEMYDPPMEYPGASEYEQELESSEAAVRRERAYRDNLEPPKKKTDQQPETKAEG